MPADSQTFIITQILIACFASLCISLAYIWFLKLKLKKLERPNYHTFEYAYDGTKAGSQSAEDECPQAQMHSLGQLAGEQLAISSELKDMTNEKGGKSLSNNERKLFIERIERLEASLHESGRKITALNVQYQQVNRDLEQECNKASNLQKVVESKGGQVEQSEPEETKTVASKEKAEVASKPVRDEALNAKVQELSDELQSKEKEIKKLRVNSSLMTKELDDLKEERGDVVQLRESLEEAQQCLRRSEAERELLESNYVSLAESSQSNRELEEALDRMKKEYEMLEQRFISYGSSGAA